MGRAKYVVRLGLQLPAASLGLHILLIISCDATAQVGSSGHLIVEVSRSHIIRQTNTRTRAHTHTHTHTHTHRG